MSRCSRGPDTRGARRGGPPARAASLGGIQNFAGNLAGLFITTFTGVMLSITKGSFVVPLAVAGVLCVVGALSYRFIVGNVEPLPPLRNGANGRNAEPNAA